jgi:hypothetical protein
LLLEKISSLKSFYLPLFLIIMSILLQYQTQFSDNSSVSSVYSYEDKYNTVNTNEKCLSTGLNNMSHLDDQQWIEYLNSFFKKIYFYDINIIKSLFLNFEEEIYTKKRNEKISNEIDKSCFNSSNIDDIIKEIDKKNEIEILSEFYYNFHYISRKKEKVHEPYISKVIFILNKYGINNIYHLKILEDIFKNIIKNSNNYKILCEYFNYEEKTQSSVKILNDVIDFFYEYKDNINIKSEINNDNYFNKKYKLLIDYLNKPNQYELSNICNKICNKYQTYKIEEFESY